MSFKSGLTAVYRFTFGGSSWRQSKAGHWIVSVVFAQGAPQAVPPLGVPRGYCDEAHRVMVHEEAQVALIQMRKFKLKKLRRKFSF